MLAVNEKLKNQYLKPIRQWKLESKSEKGVYRIVEELAGGKLTCTCPAGSFNAECRHKRIVRNKLTNNIKPEYGHRHNKSNVD